MIRDRIIYPICQEKLQFDWSFLVDLMRMFGLYEMDLRLFMSFKTGITISGFMRQYEHLFQFLSHFMMDNVMVFLQLLQKAFSPSEIKPVWPECCRNRPAAFTRRFPFLRYVVVSFVV